VNRDRTNPSREGKSFVRLILKTYVKDLIADSDYVRVEAEMLDVIRAERRLALRSAGVALVEDRQGSCMVCGRQRKFKAFAMEHPSLGVCYACHDASDSVKDLQKGNGVIAERIERVRDDLDVAINGLSNFDPRRKVLLRADAYLRQLKRDMGFPSAGLGGCIAKQEAMPLVSTLYDKAGRCPWHDTVLVAGLEEKTGKWFCFPCEENKRAGVVPEVKP
jgi:hypothetical protein